MKTIILAFMIVGISVTASARSMMVDRPGDLLELAEKLTLNIREAERIRDKTLNLIKERGRRIREVNDRLKESGLSRVSKLKLQAEKNRLEREENKYRRQALSVVKEQMDNVFESLETMRYRLEDLQTMEPAIDPEIIEAFNGYFRVSADLIRHSARGVEGASPETLAMLETLEKSLIVSRQSTDFLIKAASRIGEYQKLVSLYSAELLYLAGALEKYGHVLENEKDAITLTVSLETAGKFMDDLDIRRIEEAIKEDFSRDPADFLSKEQKEGYRRRIIKTKEAEKILKRYSAGQALPDR